MQTLDKSEIIEYSVEHGMKRKYLSKVVAQICKVESVDLAKWSST
jgi:hypothetical protein